MRRGVVLLCVLALLVPGAALPATAADEVFTVTSTGDSSDGDVGDDACADPCTLRAAMEQANASAGMQRIEFAIGTGAQTVAPQTPLPKIDDPVVIDATTQPGYDGSPIVEIDGAAAGGPGLFISFLGAGTTVRGLIVNRFHGAGIEISGVGQGEGAIPGDNVIEGNWLGLDPTGTQARPNGVGLKISRAPGNRVGGPSPEQRNVISGNTGNGVDVGIEDGGADNMIEGNYIGTTADGSAPLGNGETGVAVNAVDVTVAGNVISANGEAGVHLELTPPTTTS